MSQRHILITGGAGYIGSLLTGVLLNNGYRVTVVDKLLFGGESLLAYWRYPNFRFASGDITEPDTFQVRGSAIKVGNLRPEPFDAVIHLAAIVGFPACQSIGKEVVWRTNTEATQRIFDVADQAGVERFVFSSTYSNYGLSKDGQPVTEESPLFPQSIYAESKIAAEEFLLNQANGSAKATCAPVVYRFATLFGISPRTRFDLIINQFVLEALTKGKLIIYQRDYARSFVHVRDIADALELALSVPIEKIRGQVYNVGSDSNNYTKDEIVALVQQYVDGTTVEHKDLTFGGDMRDLRVSFAKIRRVLGYEPRISVVDGICEVRDVLTSGVIRCPMDDRYRNAQLIIQ
jgi:nucleoside-diphosphate-sugar epimerase